MTSGFSRKRGAAFVATGQKRRLV